MQNDTLRPMGKVLPMWHSHPCSNIVRRLINMAIGVAFEVAMCHVHWQSLQISYCPLRMILTQMGLTPSATASLSTFSSQFPPIQALPFCNPNMS
jgi:hypothetical protein